MKTSLILEMLRSELFAPQPDWIELDAVLSSVHRDAPEQNASDAAVIADYLVAQVVRRMQSATTADVWPAVRLAFVHASGHPNFPSRKELDVYATPEALSHLEDPVESLVAMVDMVRRGVYYMDPATRILAHIMTDERDLPVEDVSRVSRSAITLLAQAWPHFGQSRYATARAREICALLRGVERWGMRAAVHTWTGRDTWVNRDSAARVWGCCTELWDAEGREFIWDEARQCPIQALVPRYADVDAFAEVACGRSLVVEAREHSALWRSGWEEWWEQAMNGCWRIARWMLANCGVYIGSRKDRTPLELAEGASASLQSEDGALAVARTCALAQSMATVGHIPDARYLGQLVVDAIETTHERLDYLAWAKRLSTYPKEPSPHPV